MPPATIRRYAAALTGVVEACPGFDLLGVYVHGSAALGGWDPATSDVDVLVVAKTMPSTQTVAQIGALLVDRVTECPGTGLELSIVTERSAARPGAPWPYVLHVAGSTASDARIVHGDSNKGDPDLVLHYAVCRQSGYAAFGPPAATVIGAVARPVLLRALADELHWAQSNAPSHYAVLNACRALAFVREGRLLSKLDGGAWALQHGLGPVREIGAAILAQDGSTASPPLTSAARKFVAAVSETARHAS